MMTENITIPDTFDREEHIAMTFLLMGRFQGVMSRIATTLPTRDQVLLPKECWDDLREISDTVWELYTKSKAQGL